MTADVDDEHRLDLFEVWEKSIAAEMSVNSSQKVSVGS